MRWRDLTNGFKKMENLYPQLTVDANNSATWREKPTKTRLLWCHKAKAVSVRRGEGLRRRQQWMATDSPSRKCEGGSDVTGPIRVLDVDALDAFITATNEMWRSPSLLTSSINVLLRWGQRFRIVEDVVTSVKRFHYQCTKGLAFVHWIYAFRLSWSS